MANNTAEITLRLRDQVTKAYKRVRNEVQRSNASIRGSLKQTADKTRQSFRGLGGSVSKAGAGIKDFFKRFGPAAVAVTVLTAAFVKLQSAVRFVNKVSIEFGQTLSKIKAIINPSTEEMKALTAEAKRLGATTVFSANEAGEAFVELGKLGLKTNEILTATGDVLNIAAAGGTDLANAGEIVVKTMNAFNLTADSSKEVTNVMARAFTNSALDITKFQESMKLVGTSARLVGVDLKTTTAMLGVLADNSIESTMAGTSLNQAFIQLANPASKVNKIFKKMGVENKSVIEKMKILRESNIDVGQAFEVLDVRAARALNVLLNNEKAINKLQDAMNDTSFTAEKMAATMIDNVGGAQKILEANQEALGIALGEAFGPSKMKRIIFYQKVVQKATKVVEDHREEIHATASFFSGAFVGSIKIAIIAFKSLLTVVNVLETGFFTLLQGISATVAFLLKGLHKIRSVIGIKSDPTLLNTMTFAAEDFGAKAQQIADRTKDMWKPLEDSTKSATNTIAKLKKKVTDDDDDDGGGGAPFGGGGGGGDDKRKKAAQKARERILAAGKRLQGELARERLSGREKEIAELQNFEKEKSDILRRAGQSQVNLTEVVRKRRNEINKKYDDIEKNRRKAALAETVGNLETVASKWKQFGPIFKATAIAQTTIDTFTGAQAAFKSLAGIPVVGPALGGAAAAAAIGAGLARVAAIKAQKFADGGIVGGRSFAGDNVLARVNSGELIANPRQQARLLAIADGRITPGGGAKTINFSAPVINIQNGDPAVVGRAVGETYQEMIQNFSLTQRDAQLNEVVA